MRYLTKLRNSDPSETFSRLPAVSIALGDTNSVTVKSGQIWNWWKRRFIFESTTTTDYSEALFSKTDNVFETLFSNTDNRIDNLTALIAWFYDFDADPRCAGDRIDKH